LVLAASTKCPAQVITRFRNLILWLLPLNLLLTGVLSGWYTGRSLAPVAELTQRAAQMSERVSQSGTKSLWTPLVVANPDDELGRLAETFNLLAQRVEAALRQLRQFVSDASHELRTPLTVLQGETELVLSENRSTTDYKKALLIIHGELKKLNRMVEGLFTLSMADAGQLRLQHEPVYVNEILEESCALATPHATLKGISIERDLCDEISLMGDESFLRELFLIFLDNAVKYSPSNTQVQVELQQVNGSVRARFQDQGIGIAAEHLPRIFERFYRAAPSVSGGTQSGGLGLSIAQAIVQAHNGSIECKTNPGQGSTFTVTLPIGTAQSYARRNLVTSGSR
jgi:two-component system, OmpR family, sensor kinase